MQITVGFIVDVPEDADINAAESMVVEAGRRAMAEALQASVDNYEKERILCPYCGNGDIVDKGMDHRVLLTSFGRVALTIRRMRCQQCKQRFRPADPYLACLGETNMTSALVSSYDRVIKELGGLSGVRMKVEQVRCLIQRAETQGVLSRASE